MPPKGYKILATTVPEELYYRFLQHAKRSSLTPSRFLRLLVEKELGNPSDIDLYKHVADISVSIDNIQRSLAARSKRERY